MAKKIFCLRQIDLYRGIPEANLIEIADEAIESYREVTEILYEEGETDSKIFVVKEGEIELYKKENGKIIILETLFPGDVFGDFGTGIYSHSARVSRKSYLCQTPTQEFINIIAAHPEITFRLMQIMAERTADYENNIARLSLPAKDQLFETLKILYSKNKKRFLQKIFEFPFKISHETLAQKTGLNRVTVTKMMQQLQKEGKIIVSEKTKEITVIE